MSHTALFTIIIMTLSITSATATTLNKINEQYGDMGLYETFEISNNPKDKCQYTLLAAEKIVDMQCVEKIDSDVTLYCTGSKAVCVSKKDIFYFAEHGKMPTTKKTKYLKKRDPKLNLPFIGSRKTKNERTKITIFKNGNMTINSHFKNGYKTYFKGKYTKNLIPENAEIPMHGWKVYKHKVCQGYRNTWDCEKLY